MDRYDTPITILCWGMVVGSVIARVAFLIAGEPTSLAIDFSRGLAIGLLTALLYKIAT